MSRPIYNATIDEKYLVEALTGPAHTTSYLDIFPSDVYNTSPESRLYKLIYALLGPVGVGLLKFNYFYARLQLEEHGLQNDQLDKLYSDPFKFARRFDESYLENWKTVLDSESWNLLKSLDESYRQRATDYFHAGRLGSTPEGMRFAGRSAFGFDVRVIENYQHLFNKHSDQILNYKLNLRSDRNGNYHTEKFTIVPNGYIRNEDYAFGQTSGSNPIGQDLIASNEIDSERLRLFEHAIENIKPVNGMYGIDNGQADKFDLKIKSSLSSSDFYKVLTFVTGNSNIPWPKSNEMDNNFSDVYWVEAGIEKEAPKLRNGDSQHYQGFYRVANISASSNAIGDFKDQNLIQKFPMLNKLNPSSIWSPANALANEPEPLFITRYNDLTNVAFINDKYPSEYMNLKNVVAPKYDPNKFWISGLKTTIDADNEEYLEIDLGQARPINFLIFEILSAPLEITIYYDYDGIQEILPSITSVSCGSNGSVSYTYTTSSNHNLIAGDTVSISNITGSKNNYYNGTFAVQSVTNNTFTVYGKASNLETVETANLTNAKLEKNIKTYTEVKLDPLYPADEVLTYDAAALNKWQISPFLFTNEDNDMIITRYLKIKFNRSDPANSFLVNNSVNPPVAKSWPVVVKNLRVGRNIV